MDNDFKQSVRNKDFCFKTLVNIRKMFGTVSSTKDDFEQAEYSLLCMILESPQEIMQLVKSTLDELMERKTYFIFKVWNINELC